MKPPPDISEDQAQRLMSRLRDGELSPEGAESLKHYLERNPQALEWLEGLEALFPTDSSELAPLDKQEALSAIRKATDGYQSPTAGGSLLRFPNFFRPFAAAAAVALVGTVTWLGLRSPAASTEFEPNVVEFVASDIPDSSTFVYTDEESGWTVVWVDADSADYDSQG